MSKVNIRPNMTIDELGEVLFTYTKDNWQEVLNRNISELEQLFPEYEDATYGMYLDKLIPPIWKLIEDNGFRSTEDTKEDDFVIAGCLHFRNSIEKAKWGKPHHEKRVFWIVVENQHKAIIGTLLFELSHSHLEFNLPAQPKFLSLNEIKREEIINTIIQLEENLS